MTTLAYHYSQSDNFLKAYEYLKLSGEKSAKNYANNEAIRFYKETIRMLDVQPESMENKKEKLAIFIQMIMRLIMLSYPEGSLEILQNAEKLAQELGDDEGLLQIYGSLSYYHTFAGNPCLGLEYGERCFNSAEKIKDFGLMAQSAGQICFAYWVSGDVEKVADIGGKAIHLLEERHLEKDFFGMGYSPYSHLCVNYGGSLGYMGRFKEATSVLEKGLRNACEGMARVLLGCMVEEKAPTIIREAQRQIRHGISILEDCKIKGWSPVGYLHLGEFLTNAGRKEEALESLKKAETLYQEMDVDPKSYWLTRTKDALKKLTSAAGAEK
ncbi:MAG: hypothetical protein WBN66_00580 [Smithella sp.]